MKMKLSRISSHGAGGLVFSEAPGAVAESVEHWSHVWEIMVLKTQGQVKPMTYQIDTCRFLARCLALLGNGKD